LLRRFLGFRSLGGSLRLGLRLRSVGSRSGLGLRSGFLLRRSLLGLGVADRDDAQQRQLLAMAGLAAIVVPAALLEDRDLLALRLSDDLGRHGNLARFLELAAVAGQQDVPERDRIAGVARQLLDRDLVSRGDAILLAARAHYCEHGLQIRSY